MSKVWPTKTLGEICGFVRGPFGGSLKKSIFVEDGFAVYEQQHAIYDQFDDVRYFVDDAKFSEMQRFELRPNDLIMSCSGTMGKVAIVPNGIRRGIINQALLKLTPKNGTSPQFLKYWMDSGAFQESLKAQSGGAAIQNVASVSILKETQIALPPLPEQQRIVGILDEAFAGIATAKANAEKNLQNARALFESHLHAVFTHRSPGWVDGNLKALTTKIGSGATPRGGGESYKAAGIPLIRSLNVHDLEFRYPKLAFLDDAQADDLSNVVVQSGDVLLNITGASIARCCTVPSDVLPARVNQHVSIIRPLPEKLTSRFLNYLLVSRPYKNRLLQTGEEGGSTRQAITKAQIQDFEIAYPKALNEQQSITARLDALQTETRRLEALYAKKLVALDELKAALLHQAFSGQL